MSDALTFSRLNGSLHRQHRTPQSPCDGENHASDRLLHEPTDFATKRGKERKKTQLALDVLFIVVFVRVDFFLVQCLNEQAR